MTDVVATARAAIVAQLQAIAGIGVVHGYERYAAREGDFRTLYLADLGGGVQQIRGWNVRRTATKEVSSTLGISLRVVSWSITGYMALDDAGASEIAFDALIEAVCDGFRSHPVLGGAVADLRDLSGDGSETYGIQVTNTEPVLFSGVLCHRAQLALTTSIPLQF